MKRKLLAILALLTLVLTCNTGAWTAIADTEPATATIAYDLYSSSSGAFTQDGNSLAASSAGELKALVKDFSSRTMDVSFSLIPSTTDGGLNGGMYLFASNASDAADGIDALNVQVEHTAGTKDYKVQLFSFDNGTYGGSVSNTVALAYTGRVDVRVIVDESAINVYLDGSDVPSITKKVASVNKTGTQIGFRSQFMSQTFEEIAVSVTPDAPAAPTVKVLMVGNSYAQDTMTYAHEIARADGVNMVCGVLYYGGCTVKQHAEFIAANKAVYKYFKNGGTDRESVTFYDVLYDEDWDYITIQTGQGQQGLKETFYPYLPSLIALIENKLPHVEIGLFESWAVPACYQGTNNSRLKPYGDRSQTMYEAIVSTFSDLQRENGVRFVVPSAEAFYRMDATDVCDNMRFETSFFRDSTAHANEKGRYMLGLTMYRAITGRSVIGNTFEPIGYTYGGDAGPSLDVRATTQAVVEALFDDYASANALPPASPALERIGVRNARTVYRAGEYFDYGSIEVVAHYSDGTSHPVDTWSAELFRPLTASDTSITIHYQGVSAVVGIQVS